MTTILLLLLLGLMGLFTYATLQRNIAKLTTTPLWLLWLVIMTPALLIVAYAIAPWSQPALVPLFIISVVLCSISTVLLIRAGRGEVAKISESPAAPNESGDRPTARTLLSSLQRSKLLQPDEESLLRECFPWTLYPLHKIENLPQAVVCQGQLRGKPDTAYQKVRANIEDRFGDRFLTVFQESSLQSKPFFVLVPNPQRQDKTSPRREEPFSRPSMALALFWITLFTTTLVGASFAVQYRGAVLYDWISGFATALFASLRAAVDATAQVPPARFPQLAMEHLARPQVLASGLPYSLSLLAILGIQEFGQYLTATLHGLAATLPCFIPIPGLFGTFGAFVRIREPVPNRKVLFDLSFFGIFASLLVILPLLAWGLASSSTIALGDRAGMLNFREFDPRFSLLLVAIGKLALGDRLSEGQAILLHPMAIAAYIGLVLTAFKWMPVGKLDGGRIVHAIFGQSKAATIGQIVRFLMLVRTLVEPQFFIWALCLIVFIPPRDEPALNDVSEPDDRRTALGFIPLFFLAFLLLPAPKILLGWLNM